MSLKQRTRNTSPQAPGNFDFDALVNEWLRGFPFPSLWSTEDLAREFGISVERRQHLSRALRRAGIQPSAKLPITAPVSKKRIRTRLWRRLRTKLPEHLRKRDDLRREYYRQWEVERIERLRRITQIAQQIVA
jgi:hypothetical protein